MSDTPSSRGRRGRTRRARRPAPRPDRNHSAGADERLMRRMLAKVGARPFGHSDPLADDTEVAHPNPAAPAEPPAEAVPSAQPGSEHPSAGTQHPATTLTRRGAPRLPDWRLPDKPQLTAHDEQDLQAEEDPADEEPEQPVLGLRDRVRAWARTNAPNSAATHRPETAEAQEDSSSDGEEREDEQDTSRNPRSGSGPRRARAGRSQNWTRRPRFAAPGVDQIIRPERERRSLIEVIRATPAYVIWLLYSGSALGVGFWRGGPQWVREGVAFLVKEHPTLTDTYSLTCYGIAAAVLLLDYRARKWILPLAWAARIPTACLVAGVAMYGDPTPISQMTL
ncbi:hypothetical protein ACIBEA_38690 [Streptomyces sp. NPDC051555]|uniref:hypothetical protein n=1 Tax=Streptomyces sp. NPDC051555 TaxID=3365657 RepID=UPI00379D8963